MMKKMPPLEKVYEAYSAISDGRVALDGQKARVHSSDRAKTYTVAWTGDVYASDDSATYWQGYAGYPVLAVLMLQNRLPLDRELAQRFAGVDWHTLNAEYGRDYAAAAAKAMDMKGIPAGAASAQAQRVLKALETLPLTLKRGRRPAKTAE